MKRHLLLLAGATALSWPVAAQEHAHPPNVPTTIVTSAGIWSDAQKTWADVREQSHELDALIAQRKLTQVHDAALSLRDSVRELRFGRQALEPAQQTDADTGIRKIDGLLDALHETADHNDLKGTVQNQRTLHLLLDEVASAFPTQVLTKVGPVVATGAVKDPYCRMTVDPATAAAKVAYAGQTYYFCAQGEAQKFKSNPRPYAKLFDELTFGKPKQYSVTLGTSGPVKARQPTALVFAIREQGQSALTTQFQPVHEKLFHLIAVSDDLSWFGHLHPHQASDGRFYLKQEFPRDGRYFLYSDFTPANGTNTIAHSEVRVGSGVTRSPQKLVADRALSRVMDGVQVKLNISAPLQAGRQTLFTYSLSRNGKPVTDMTPYLAAMGHMMAVSQNGREVVHTHAVSSGKDATTGLNVTSEMSTAKGPTQSFKLELPGGGLYKIWAQFGINGQILTVPFTFQVKENPTMKNIKPTAILAAGALAMGGVAIAKNNDHSKMGHTPPAKIAVTKTAPNNVQKITIALPQGYKTGVASVKAGKPVALTFYLQSDAGCGNTVSLPAAKWTKALKVGQRATVVYTPTKSGPLAFECSMGHMKGTLTVK